MVSLHHEVAHDGSIEATAFYTYQHASANIVLVRDMTCIYNFIYF